VRLSCLARNGRSPGEESLTGAVAVQAIEAQPAFGQIKPMRGEVLVCAEQHFGDVPASDRPTQEAQYSPRRKRNPVVQKGVPVVVEQAEASANARDHWVGVCRRDDPAQSKCSGNLDIAVMVTTGSPCWS
jgi:hypothetical protein